MIKIEASFDDGSAEDLRIAHLCEKYGIPVTFYVPVDYIGLAHRNGYEPLTPKGLAHLAKKHEIGSHTITHPMLTRITLQEATNEIVESKRMLERIIDKEVYSFCYPRGYANDKLRDVVRQHYRSARNTLVGSLEEPTDPVWKSTSVHIAGVRRPEYENTTWLKEGLKMWEKAKETKNAIFHFWGHGWEITRYDAWKDFEKFLKGIA